MFCMTTDSKQIIYSNYRQQQVDKEREIPQTPL